MLRNEEDRRQRNQIGSRGKHGKGGGRLGAEGTAQHGHPRRTANMQQHRGAALKQHRLPVGDLSPPHSWPSSLRSAARLPGGAPS